MCYCWTREPNKPLLSLVFKFHQNCWIFALSVDISLLVAEHVPPGVHAGLEYLTFSGCDTEHKSKLVMVLSHGVNPFIHLPVQAVMWSLCLNYTLGLGIRICDCWADMLWGPHNRFCKQMGVYQLDHRVFSGIFNQIIGFRFKQAITAVVWTFFSLILKPLTRTLFKDELFKNRGRECKETNLCLRG